MRPSSAQASMASRFALCPDRGRASGGARAQNSPPAPSVQGAPIPGKYRLGVWIEPVSQWNGQSWIPSGLRIIGVNPGSPAERAGIQTGNVVTSVNGIRVTRPEDLLRALDNSGGRATLGLHDGRGSTSRQVPSFSWAPPVARTPPHDPDPLHRALPRHLWLWLDPWARARDSSTVLWQLWRCAFAQSLLDAAKLRGHRPLILVGLGRAGVRLPSASWSGVWG